MKGSSFVGAAAGYFLFPLCLAVAGAAFSGSDVGQFIGAAAGFASGMAVAGIAVRLRRRPYEEAA